MFCFRALQWRHPQELLKRCGHQAGHWTRRIPRLPRPRCLPRLLAKLAVPILGLDTVHQSLFPLGEKMGPGLKLFSALLILLLSSGQIFAADRDATAGDLRGIPKSHRYAWAVLGGTAAGAGIGVIAPGGNKSAVKGLLIGGSLTSAFWLAKHPRAAEGKRPFAHIVTNTILGTSVLWTICYCGEGAWAGALLGGGGTALIQAFGTHHSAIAQGIGGASDQASQTSRPIVFG